MNLRRKTGDDAALKTPTWIVSFADMTTLLLTFFVLLQAFATEQHKELFLIGQGSFRRAIAGLGIPDLLFGKAEKVQMLYERKKHPTESDEENLNRSRVLDADDEKIRLIFAELQRSLQTKSSDVQARQVRASSAGIRFAAGSCELDAPAREALRAQAARLGQNLRAEAVKVYVVALAADASDRRQQYLLSAARARAVEAVLADALSSECRRAGWTIDSWGAGAGGPWCANFGVDPAESHVLIAVMGENRPNGQGND